MPPLVVGLIALAVLCAGAVVGFWIGKSASGWCQECGSRVTVPPGDSLVTASSPGQHDRRDGRPAQSTTATSVVTS